MASDAVEVDAGTCKDNFKRIAASVEIGFLDWLQLDKHRLNQLLALLNIQLKFISRLSKQSETFKGEILWSPLVMQCS